MLRCVSTRVQRTLDHTTRQAEEVTGMPDDLFLYIVGILVIAAQHLNAITGWAMPVLVDKT